MKKLSILSVLVFSFACGSSQEAETMPPQQPAPAADNSEPADMSGDMDKQPDIVDTAIAAGSFKTLVAALQAAELVEALRGEGPFTVFAPTDEAFAKLPEGTVDALLADKEKLTAILTYHVVKGKVMAADVVKLKSATTLQGGELAIDATDGVKIGNSTVIKADIATSNGVIHVIDTVLIPN